MNLAGITSQVFYTDCVSFSRVCVLPKMANAWPASQTWPYKVDGYATLNNKMKNHETTVYVDFDTTNDHESFSGYSFKSDGKHRLKYSDFLTMMSQQASGMTMREVFPQQIAERIVELDIAFPEFYHEFAQLEGIEIT